MLPFVAFLLLCGVYLRGLIEISFLTFSAVLFIGIALCLFIAYGRNRYTMGFKALKVLAVIAIGYSLAFAYDWRDSTVAYPNEAVIEGVIVDSNAVFPDEGIGFMEDENSETSLTLCLNRVFLDGERVNGKLYLTVNTSNRSPDERYSVGNTIRVTSDVNRVSAEYVNQQQLALRRQGITRSATVEDGRVFVAKTGNAPLLYRVKNSIRSTLLQGMDEKYGTQAYSMIVGGSSVLSDETKEAYSSLGIMHLFAVSGLHVSALALALTWLLSRFRIPLKASGVVVSLMLILYAFLCGLSPSIVRASVMYIVYIFARCRGLRYDAISALALAAIIQICIFPLSVLELSFLFSYGLIVTILALTTPIKNVLSFMPNKLGGALSAGLAANTAVVSSNAFFFGESVTFTLLINLIVIPLAAAFITLLMSLTILCIIIPPISPVLGFLNYAFAGLELLCDAFSYISIANVTTDNGVLATLILLPLVFLACKYYVTDEKFKNRVTILCVGSVLLLQLFFVLI